MPNRTVIFAAAIFVILVIGLLSQSGGSKGRINDDQDFGLVIPPSQSNTPQGDSPLDALHQEDVQLSDDEQRQALAEVLAREHIRIESKVTKNKKWWPLDFVTHNAFNPNILPHPHPLKSDQFVMVAQETIAGHSAFDGFFKELICDARFENDTMRCIEEPELLPVAATVSNKCDTKLDAFNYQAGPHDARVFYGVDRPFIIYGSPSSHSCMGMWMQDLSRLHSWDYQEPLEKTQAFFQATDLDRPAPYGKLEKNWFAFFGRNGDMYLHYNLYPKRSFAAVNMTTGQIGSDLAQITESHDQECMAKHMPRVKYPSHERIHQATNAISVTLCDYIFEDPVCFEQESNTFLMSIFHLKTSFLHDVYEPYVVLFQRTPPFELYAIGSKPIWINGREKQNMSAPTDQLFYVTSMAYTERMRNFHGYQNDQIFLTFGIEDERSGAIDTTPGDLLKDLNYCV